MGCGLCCHVNPLSVLYFLPLVTGWFSFFPAGAVRSVSVESRHGNRSAAERKRPTLGPEHSVTQTHNTCTHSCSHLRSAKKYQLMVFSLENPVLKWLPKYCQRKWDHLFPAQFNRWQHVTWHKAKKVDYYYYIEDTVYTLYIENEWADLCPFDANYQIKPVDFEHFESEYEVKWLVMINLVSATIHWMKQTNTLYLLSPTCCVSVLPSLRFPSVVFLLLCPEGLSSSSLPPAPVPLQYLHPLFLWLFTSACTPISPLCACSPSHLLLFPGKTICVHVEGSGFNLLWFSLNKNVN